MTQFDLTDGDGIDVKAPTKARQQKSSERLPLRIPSIPRRLIVQCDFAIWFDDPAG